MIRSDWLAYKAQEFSCLYFIPPPTRLVFQAYPAPSFWHGLWRAKFSMCNQACTPKSLSPNLLPQHSAQTFKSSLSFQSVGISVLWLAFRDTSSSPHHSCSLPHLLAVSLPSSQHGKRGGMVPGDQILPGFTNAKQCCASRLLLWFLVDCLPLSQLLLLVCIALFYTSLLVFLMFFSLSSHAFILSFKWPRIGLGLLVHVLSYTHFQVLNTMMKVSWCLTSCCLTTHQRFMKHTLKKAELCWMHTYQRRH